MNDRLTSERSQGSRWLLVLAALLADSVLADAFALDQIPIPPHATSRAIALDLVQNGHVVSIATLETDRSMEDMLSFYRSAWHSNTDVPGYVVAHAGDWQVVSHLTDRHNLVVQLREDRDGVEGIVSALSLESTGSKLTVVHDVPPGGAVLSTTTSRDFANSATTTVVGSHWRTGQVAAFYRDRLVRAGWSLTFEDAIAGPSVLLFERRGHRLELIVSESMDGGSVAVLNEVTPDA